MKRALHKNEVPTPIHHRLAIIGAGVLGTSLAIALSRRGYIIAGVADSRTEAIKQVSDLMGGIPHSTHAAQIAKQADLILITTSDDAIAEVCQAVAAGGGCSKGDVVLHCSGAVSSAALTSARSCGASVAAMHPIGVFADIETAVDQLSGIFYSIEGDAKAVDEAEHIVTDLGGFPLRVTPEQKMRLHIAACLTANYTVTLIDMAVALLTRDQMSRHDAVQVLDPLLSGTVRTLERKGLPGALTGPIARGDVSTIGQHMAAIHQDQELTRIYALLGLRTLALAREKGTLDERTLRTIRDLFTEVLGTDMQPHEAFQRGGDQP